MLTNFEVGPRVAFAIALVAVYPVVWLLSGSWQMAAMLAFFSGSSVAIVSHFHQLLQRRWKLRWHDKAFVGCLIMCAAGMVLTHASVMLNLEAGSIIGVLLAVGLALAHLGGYAAALIALIAPPLAAWPNCEPSTGTSAS